MKQTAGSQDTQWERACRSECAHSSSAAPVIVTKNPRVTRPQYMAIDQYGNTWHGLTHPRKDLCARLGVQHAEKMYAELKDGGERHVGYVIAGHWLDVYEVRPFRA